MGAQVLAPERQSILADGGRRDVVVRREHLEHPVDERLPVVGVEHLGGRERRLQADDPDALEADQQAGGVADAAVHELGPRVANLGTKRHCLPSV